MNAKLGDIVQEIDYKTLIQQRQNNNLQLIITEINSPNFTFNALLHYIDLEKYKQLKLTTNINENTIKIFRNNNFTSKLFASCISKDATKEYKYWQKQQIDIINNLSKYYENRTNIIVTNNNIQYRPNNIPPLFSIKNIQYRPNKTAPIFDAKINGIINGYVVCRVLFDAEIHKNMNIFDDLSIYCEWFARYADPEHYLFIIIDIDNTFTNLSQSLQNFKELWSIKPNIVINNHIQSQLFIINKLNQLNQNPYDCCTIIQKQLHKLLSN